VNRHQQSLKRVMDVALAGTGLLLASPLLLTVAVAVKLQDGGPVLFTQERVGRRGKAFRLIKFRTMVEGAEGAGPQITAGGDSRITRLGRWLRRSKLDELPQLLNVLSGTMSLVGPRPEVPKYVAMFAAEFGPVLKVRPGITDEASILFRNEEQMLAAALDPDKEYVEAILPRKLALYQQYVEQQSLSRDIGILARTLRVIIIPDRTNHEHRE
jgi:lipopolysaccharide/colanic/teichoic acid biosynthesis glycosyltransferase